MVDSARSPLLLSDVTGRILKVFYAVYNELGHGFRELVYRRALLIALNSEGLVVQTGVELPVWFRGSRIATFEPDIVIENGPVLLELKAKPAIEPLDVAQTLNYLKASDIEVALLLNFGNGKFQRLVFENARKGNRPAFGAGSCGEVPEAAAVSGPASESGDPRVRSGRKDSPASSG